VTTPPNALGLVRRLAEAEDNCVFFQPVLTELRRHGLDSDDLRDILCSELGDVHCFKSSPTRRYYPATVSDYYSIWIDECGAKMFIKLLISGERLVITSFKKDERYG
jgi:hypothetical protein